MKKEKVKALWNKILPFTFLNSLGMGLLKIIIAIITRSLGLFISSLYNFIISITKKNLFSKKESSIYSKYIKTGIFIIIASILYINYSIAVMKLHINSSYHMYVAILIATVTFTDITIATIGIIKAKKKNDLETEILKYINLSTALISLSLTQTSILSFTMQGQDMSNWNGIGGIVIGSLVCIIGMYMAVNGNIKMINENIKSK